MKCEHCPYLYYPEYESNYTSCLVFGDGIPDDYERKDGEGCIFNRKQLAKMCRENEEAFAKECGAFVEWFEKQNRGVS